MKKDLQDLIIQDSVIAGLLYEDDGVPSVTWGTRPDGAALPAITLENVSKTTQHDQSGKGGFQPSRVQFDIWGANYKAVSDIFDRLEALLTPEEFQSLTQGQTIFDRCFLDGDRDLPVQDLEGGQRVFHIAADFIIWHRSTS